jgi:hypothetical protein
MHPLPKFIPLENCVINQHLFFLIMIIGNKLEKVSKDLHVQLPHQESTEMLRSTKEGLLPSTAFPETGCKQ